MVLGTADLLSLEMKFKDLVFVSEHLTHKQPITYLILNIEAPYVVNYSINQSLLLSILKFAKNLSSHRITGSRSG